jgi:hypothetical protein
MSSDPVPVLFIAGMHAFAGSLDHSSSRVLDVLNGAGTEFLRIRDASVFRGLQGAPIGQFSEITVPKSSIDCLVLTAERHEAPLQRKYALVEKKSHAVFVLLENYELRGQVMFARSVDPILMLNASASSFFPIIEATLTSAGSATCELSAKVVFVNKSNVAALQIDERASSPSGH